MVTTKLFRIFGDSIFAHPSPDILTKHNRKETASKRNIWGPFYITKRECSDGDQIRRKYSTMKTRLPKP